MKNSKESILHQNLQITFLFLNQIFSSKIGNKKTKLKKKNFSGKKKRNRRTRQSGKIPKTPGHLGLPAHEMIQMNQIDKILSENYPARLKGQTINNVNISSKAQRTDKKHCGYKTKCPCQIVFFTLCRCRIVFLTLCHYRIVFSTLCHCQIVFLALCHYQIVSDVLLLFCLYMSPFVYKRELRRMYQADSS